MKKPTLKLLKYVKVPSSDGSSVHERHAEFLLTQWDGQQANQQLVTTRLSRMIINGKADRLIYSEEKRGRVSESTRRFRFDDDGKLLRTQLLTPGRGFVERVVEYPFIVATVEPYQVPGAEPMEAEASVSDEPSE